MTGGYDSMPGYNPVPFEDHDQPITNAQMDVIRLMENDRTAIHTLAIGHQHGLYPRRKLPPYEQMTRGEAFGLLTRTYARLMILGIQELRTRGPRSGYRMCANLPNRLTRRIWRRCEHCRAC